jgi:hypothetical protein
MPVTRQEPPPAIVAVLHDGFYSCGTGAGRSNRAFLETLTSMLAPGVQLLVLPIHLAPDSPEYSTRWHAAMETLIRQARGQLIQSLFDYGSATHPDPVLRATAWTRSCRRPATLLSHRRMTGWGAARVPEIAGARACERIQGSARPDRAVFTSGRAVRAPAAVSPGRCPVLP